MALKPTDPSRAQIELLAKLTKSKCFNPDEREQTIKFLKYTATKRTTIQLIERAKGRIAARNTLTKAIKEGDQREIKKWLTINRKLQVKDTSVLTAAERINNQPEQETA